MNKGCNMKLSALFETCLHIPYETVGETANYALKRAGKTLYLFFQGSDGATDWKNNLDFPLKAHKRKGDRTWFAHRGFLKVWKEIEPYLAKDIADPYFQEIVVVGYSHGGAIASLCVEYIWFHRPDLRGKTTGYGFGSPRVFWGIKGKRIRQRWKGFSVVRNLDDLVTHMPPAFLGYSHVGELLEIGEQGKYARIEAHFADNILRELLIYEKT